MKRIFLGLFTILLLQFLTTPLSAQKQSHLFVVFLNTNPDRETLPSEEVEKLQAAHIANIDSLYKTGDLVAAGPFDDGGGIFILVAKDSAKAEKIFNTDPAIQAGRFKLEYFPFKISAGGICKYKEPVKMKSYGFVRWSQIEGKEIELVQYGRLLDKQADFFTESHLRDSLLIAGNFGLRNEGIMLFNLSSKEEIKLVVETSPIHNSGHFTYKFRKLWTAEGTFCRKE
ncbi:MAG: YciI family protein [Bacteroidales bacterium]|nr:YciI family protein [Bacteroidales bacterium]MCF8455394.1 YciI family protein [Bacteroidales bacterium]